VIDSGIDTRHPELANTIADSFDALGSKEGPLSTHRHCRRDCSTCAADG